jgi:hypothetical protein
MADSIKKIVALGLLAICAVVSAGSPRAPLAQSPANNPLPNWWPTRDYSGLNYAGSGACAKCHEREASTQSAAPMAHALEAAGDCRILIAHPRLTFRNGPYTYEIKRQGDRSIYTVSNGAESISVPVLYCFGQGASGQTYVFQHNNVFYESRVSYYRELQGLNITTLHSRAVPASLEAALGRPMSPEAARGCFSCHSTGAVRGGELRLDRLAPGVTCEACHGPGENHIAAVRSKDPKDLQIFNPARLDAFDQMQEFCGACHQSFDAVMLLPDQGGINNVRFQPYRMFKSRGHFINDHRISCTACHDPHDKSRHEAEYYDSKCFACHVSDRKEARTEARMAGACPVGKRECVTCHMPKVEVPDMHFKFTDHWIRIVKPGSPVPR